MRPPRGHQVYPELVLDVRIRVIELQDHVLSTYDRAISDYTATEFSRCGARAVSHLCSSAYPRGACGATVAILEHTSQPLFTVHWCWC